MNETLLNICAIVVTVSLAVLGYAVLSIYRMMKREHDEYYTELEPLIQNSTTPVNYCPGCYCKKCIKERTGNYDSDELEQGDNAS